MTRTGSKDAFRRLTRSDLFAFDQEAKDLILEAMAIGCIGRVSTKGHCILRNNTGGTASIPRNMTSANRTAQNARADIRRLMSTHRPERPIEKKGDEATTEEMTVSRAFVIHGPAFSRWFDARPEGLPAEAIVIVTTRPDGEVEFAVAESAQEKGSSTGRASGIAGDGPLDEQVPDEEASEPENPAFTCSVCNRSFAAATALGSHRRVHRTQPALTISALARANGISRDAVRDRLIQARPEGDDGIDITPRDVEKAGLTMPTTNTSPDANTAGDAAETLRRVRAALGDDPRIAELEAEKQLLQKELTEQRTRADELQAKLEIIQEAVHV